MNAVKVTDLSKTFRVKHKEKGMKGIMVENCGLPEERIYRQADEMPENASYYTIIVVKENGHD